MLKKVITISGLLFISTLGFSQTAEQLKKENQKLKSENEKLKLSNNDLKAKVDFCTSIEKNSEVTVKTFTDFYNIKVLKCKGNKAEQSVTLDILVSQSKVNQYFKIESAQAIDLLGNLFNGSDNVTVGGSRVYHSLLTTDAPIKISIKFTNILPGNQNFKTVSLSSSTYNTDISNKINGIIELRNITIEW